jgi:hypothetical protein
MTPTSDETLNQLEHEAEQARTTLSGKIGQVRHRLEAEEIKNEVMGQAREVIGEARQAGSRLVHERGRQLKDTVLEAAINNPVPALAVGTVVVWSIWRRVSQIPPPILLVCAGGIAGLMRWNGGTGRRSRHGYPDRYGETQPEPSLPGGERIGAAESSIGERASQAADRAREAAYEAGTQASDAAGRAGSAVSEVAGRTAWEIRRAAGDATTTASAMAREAQSQVANLVDRHPLVLGAIGVALGAAIAAAVRPTETEARLVGETSDTFKRRAREMLEEQFERARTIAERAYEAASDEAREQGVSVDAVREAVAELGGKLGAVAESAKQAARDEAGTEARVSDRLHV